MTNQESIKIWNTTNISLIQSLSNDLKKSHYLLDKKNNTYTYTFIEELFNIQKDNTKEETFIELWHPDTSISSFQISYIKKEIITFENPIATLAIFLSDVAPSIISFDLDFEQYKYKTFTPENNCIIIPAKKGKIVSIDPTHFYGFHSSNNNNNNDTNIFENILMINLWSTKPAHLEYYSNKLMEETTSHLDIIEELESLQEIYIENTIFNEQFYEELLYKKNNLVINDLYSQINENYPQVNLDTTNLIIRSQKKPLQNKKYFQEKREKYGNILNDIYELEVNKIITKNLQQKINIPFFFSQSIINWYNIELNNNAKLWKPIENNTSKFNLEMLPYLSTFIFTHTEEIIYKIKEIYQLGSLNININKYFIEKLQLVKESKLEKINNYFLSFFILLKGSMKMCFENEPNHMYIVNTGDLIVFGCENYSIKSNSTEDIIVLGCNIEYTI